MPLPDLGPRGEGWVAAQSLLLLAVLALGPLAAGAAPPLVVVAGVIVAILGVAVAVVGVLQLGSSLSPLPRPSTGARLVERGIYRRVRHPIYLGLVLGSLGWSLAFASIAALVASALLAVVLDLKARREERWLLDRYPGYASYRDATARFLPGVY